MGQRKAVSKFTSPLPRIDVKERCQVFKMSSLNEDDQRFLAHLYRTIYISGGVVQIREVDGETESYSF